MRPYIIINGVNSNNINGLLISKLPPISKAQMRTEVEEIDGRDGDIVTPLGLQAYDKDIEIGLYGQYNVDDVIAFFNSSGRITFSNEPDKYYNFAIYNKIDFERLIRYKTAVVTLHVQPFKYSALEFPKTATAEEGAETCSLTVRNRGNTHSKPTLTIKGAGIMSVLINNVHVLQIDLSTAQQITIDSVLMEAYNGATLLNRHVVGNYDNVSLHSGVNTVTVNGNVTGITIDHYSRWI